MTVLVVRDADTETVDAAVRASSASESGGNVGNWAAILVMVMFVLSNIAVIFPLRIPIPFLLTNPVINLLVKHRIIPPRMRGPRRFQIHLNFITVPLTCVLILLACKAIDGEVLKRGILGADGVKPINIMALFISLAYMAISLDFMGLLRFSAFWVARKGGSSGKRLYLYLYLFFLVCGVIVGNDPVILSGTAFLAYFTRVTGIAPPTAWIFSQFAAANMASVVLVSSNPTNLVLSGAFGLSFVKYTAHVILPFLAAAVLVYPVLLFALFRKRGLIPTTLGLELDERDSSAAASGTLVDKHGAIFGSILLATTLAVLVGTSTIGVSVWQVTVPPALVMLLRDGVHDWMARHRDTPARPHAPRTESLASQRARAAGEFPLTELSRNDASSQTVVEGEDITEVPRTPPSPAPPATPSPPTSAESTAVSTRASSPAPRATLAERCGARLQALCAAFPTVTTIASRLPLALLPFAFLMFVLVQALSSQGWVQVFARWWAAWVARTGTLGAIGGMGFLACVFCNICGTNIGATILLARVLQDWLASGAAGAGDARTRDGAIFALAVGSNYGAFTLTFSASLAGLLWRQILRDKGIHVRAAQFLLLNAPIALVAMLASSAVLVGQVYITHRNDKSV
ncbi:hypothetical protein PsYK624_108410 [Phanerochaete sordida]|uniref:Citrate transporter-like domain-containing protein n=1 Tax=Phanerochaete sordida TaxID=48140 RepID=A0A9P3GGR7_9APHY|nr:hypothetical protein PsYK624_108410 [Phanerochaete sordida]